MENNEIRGYTIIRQAKKIIYHSGVVENVVEIYDDFTKEEIDLNCDSFYDDDMELLDLVVKRYRDDDRVIDEGYINERGLEINGTWYEYEKIKSHLIEEQKEV